MWHYDFIKTAEQKKTVFKELILQHHVWKIIFIYEVDKVLFYNIWGFPGDLVVLILGRCEQQCLNRDKISAEPGRIYHGMVCYL